MSDNRTPEQRHLNMAAIHSASTKPELVLRKAMWRLGYRFRLNEKRLPGKPDIVLSKYHTVIFVHGCFWHGHKGCKYYAIPKTNTDFWKAKISRNQERDQEVWRQLEAKGWAVIIVWECELKKNRFSETLDSVTKQIQRNGEAYHFTIEERRRTRETYRIERMKNKSKSVALKAELSTIFPK